MNPTVPAAAREDARCSGASSGSPLLFATRRPRPSARRRSTALRTRRSRRPRARGAHAGTAAPIDRLHGARRCRAPSRPAAVRAPATRRRTRRGERRCRRGPSRCAARRRRARPVAIARSARLRPIVCASRSAPPHAGMMPSVTWLKPILTSSAAMRMSAAMATSAPPPSAWPLSAAMTGTGKAATRSRTPPHAARHRDGVLVRADRAELLEVATGDERAVSAAPQHEHRRIRLQRPRRARRRARRSSRSRWRCEPRAGRWSRRRRRRRSRRAPRRGALGSGSDSAIVPVSQTVPARR